MDALDLSIIEILQREGRTPQHEIARRVSLSQPAVAERIKKLEEKGVITGYVATVDAAALGNDVTAFVGVAIEHPRHFEAFARRIRGVPEVLECHRVAGEFTYLLKVKTANTRSLDRLLTRELRTLAGVTRSFTTIALASIKETTAVPIDRSAREEAA